jgi:hypothetical protein
MGKLVACGGIDLLTIDPHAISLFHSCALRSRSLVRLRALVADGI